MTDLQTPEQEQPNTTTEPSSSVMPPKKRMLLFLGVFSIFLVGLLGILSLVRQSTPDNPSTVNPPNLDLLPTAVATPTLNEDIGQTQDSTVSAWLKNIDTLKHYTPLPADHLPPPLDLTISL